jgi:hypothetical protein
MEMAMSRNMPLLARLVTTGMLTTVIGGLLSGYQWSYGGEPPLTHVIPAFPEMMQLLRDEHGLVANMVKAQLATEQAQTAQGVGADRDRKAAAR